MTVTRLWLASCHVGDMSYTLSVSGLCGLRDDSGYYNYFVAGAVGASTQAPEVCIDYGGSMSLGYCWDLSPRRVNGDRVVVVLRLFGV